MYFTIYYFFYFFNKNPRKFINSINKHMETSILKYLLFPIILSPTHIATKKEAILTYGF
jgi:branched-subunit amino acid transport protein AzlD